jgi:hypothetical protein
MALEKTTGTPFGITVENAHHRVEGVVLNKISLQFKVRSYVSLDHPAFTETVHMCPYDIDGENPIKQAYEYLKTTDQFSDAKDC